MTTSQAGAAEKLSRALGETDGSLTDLLARFDMRGGAALLAALGCTGNTVALWEQLTHDLARHLLRGDEVAALVEAWLPFPAALAEFGERALAHGADPLNPSLTPQEKLRVIARLSRSAQVAFETYALAREVAATVVARLRPARAPELD